MSAEVFIKLQKGIGGVLYGFCVIKTGGSVGIKSASVSLLEGLGKKVVVGILEIPRATGQQFQVRKYGVLQVYTTEETLLVGIIYGQITPVQRITQRYIIWSGQNGTGSIVDISDGRCNAYETL